MKTNVQNIIETAFELHKQGKLDEAQKLYLQILNKNPNDLNALNLLGMLKTQKKDFESAIYYLEKACKLTEDYFDIFFNLALAYKNNGQIEKAIQNYEKALSIEPKNPDACFNIANIYEKQNNTQKALEYYQKAYENNIDYDGIHYFLGVGHLKLKNFKEGWKFYEGRPSKKFAITSQELVYPKIMKTKPIWNGTAMPDQTLFVYYDSALGDTIMFARYLPMLTKMFKKVLFKPQQCFIDLFKENNLGTEIVDNKTLPDDLEFDTHIPIMSIPYILQLNEERDIPFWEGYFKANTKKVQDYKQRFFGNDKIKIGIKWMGNPYYDKERIIPISCFYKLFKLKNTQFYSLQKGEGIEELQKIPSEYNLINLGDTFEDFTDTEAAIENLDLIICNDTSVAHLAGAMGKATWVLLPFVQNWRWHNDLTYSPWYESVKLFKQSQPDNWDEVFEEVYDRLLIKHNKSAGFK